MINIYCNESLQSLLKSNNIENYSTAYGGESAGLDLYNTGQDIIIKPSNEKENNSIFIKTGIHLIVPKGYVALVQERGSITKTSLKVRAGVIDSGYTGEVFVNLVNLSNKEKIICEGEKLPVQIVVVKCDNHFNSVSYDEYLNLTNLSQRKEGKVGSSD